MPDTAPQSPVPETPANAIISLFGGVRPLAKKLNLAASTVQGWKLRNHIPEAYHVQLQQIANDTNDVEKLDTLIKDMGAPPQDTSVTTPSAPVSDTPSKPAPRPMMHDPNYRYTSMPQATMRYWILSSLASFGLSVLVLIVLLIVFFGHDIFDYLKGERPPVFQNMVATQAPAPSLVTSANLDESRQAINNTLNDIRKVKDATPVEQTALRNDIVRIESSLEQLQARVENMDKTLQEKDDTSATLHDRINAISQRDIMAAALLLGVAQLHRIMDDESRFSDDLLFLKALLSNEPELVESIDKLAPFAATGLMTREDMISTLGAVSRETATISLQQPNLSWSDKLRMAVKNVVDIRLKTDKPQPTVSSSTLNTAMRLLNDNNYAQAAHALQDYKGPDADKIMQIAYNMQGRAAAQNLMDALLAKGKALVNINDLTQTLSPAPPFSQ